MTDRIERITPLSIDRAAFGLDVLEGVTCDNETPDGPCEMTTGHEGSCAVTTYPVELGGSMGGSLPSQPVAGVKARVNPGRPATAGPAVCRGCRSLVWWSGALWTDRDGTWHRCSFITPLAATGPEGTIGP